uniref:Dystrophin n=1 Tax=Callorhinchus milii TaxID=7868 RepID=A0A4W3GT88_CALMI
CPTLTEISDLLQEEVTTFTKGKLNDDQELQDGIGSQHAVVTSLNVTGKEIIDQSSTADAGILKEKLSSLNRRWQGVCRQVDARKKRLEEDKTLLSELQKDLKEFNCWLEEGERIVRIELVPGNEQNLKDSLETVKLQVDEIPS